MPEGVRLYIMRHGEAQIWASRDADRALTERGRADVLGAARYLADRAEPIESFWVSPLRRARETAELVNRTLGREAEPEVSESLTPEADCDALCEQLYQSGAESLLLVSHMPLVGELLHRLAGEEPGRYPMGTASLACLTGDLLAPDLMSLAWLRHREAE